MKTSDKGLEFIKSAEGCRYTAYQDTGGVWTIGVGHTGPDVMKGLQASPIQVLQWLREDVSEAEDAVTRLVRVPLSQGQFDALVDFVFNLGEGQFKKSTLLRKLNAGDYKGAGNEFKRWVYDNGVILPGLVKRRYGAAAMFRGE